MRKLLKVGRNQRLLSGALVGIAGGLVALAISETMHGLNRDWLFLRSAAGGACFAGLMLAGTFGRAGRRGWIFAALGFFCATVLGSALALAVMYLETSITGGRAIGFGRIGLEGFVFAPVFVVTMAVTRWAIAITWTACCVAVHLILARAILKRGTGQNAPTCP